MTVDGVRLHYVVKGSGEPIVIFHGNGSLIDDMVISGLVDLLARNHRVVVFDRPGFGYSGRPRSRVWTPHAQAALLARALDRLQLGRATLIGHSWGTLVAVAMALSKPSRVRSLVLVSGYYYPEGRVDIPVASAPAVPLVGDVLRYTVAPAVSSLMLPRIYKRIFAPEPVPARFERKFPHELVLRPSHLRAASADSALLIPATLELERHYRELNLPVAILAGEGDQIVDPARHSLRLHREISQSTCRIVPRLGHMMHYGGLDAIADAVAEVEHAASGVADLQNA